MGAHDNIILRRSPQNSIGNYWGPYITFAVIRFHESPQPKPQNPSPKPLEAQDLENPKLSFSPSARNSKSPTTTAPLPTHEAYNLGTAPHTVTVCNRATIKVLIYLYYEYYPADTEWGQYPTYNPRHGGASIREMAGRTAPDNLAAREFIGTLRGGKGEGGRGLYFLK